MPSISFDMPHWAYWATLILFPLVAMVMARRGRITEYSLPIGYFILLTGGLFGLHRFYLRNLWGMLYVPLIIGMLWANAQGRDARNVQSNAANAVRIAEQTVARQQPRVEGADARLAELEAALAAAEPGGFAETRARRALERETAAVQTARERLAEAEAARTDARPALEAATDTRAFWTDTAFALLCAALALIAFDALALPTLVAAAQARTAAGPAEIPTETADATDDAQRVGEGWRGMVDRISLYTGEFVSYWAVIAVIVYYYEVIARYVFNSPSNWAHEGMFLMLGMQYLIAGAYAMLTDAHVKVDIFYANWSPLRRAVVDLFTSIFFFIFAGTLLATGWIFAMDATRIGELSFSEWQIAYWPFKWAIALGGLLLLLQGAAKLAGDLAAVRDAAAGRA